MTPERWREIESLFEKVADLSSEQRQQILVQTDPEIRSEVLSLLACDGQTVSTVHDAVREGAHSVGRSTVHAWVGRRLGPWRITGTLGQGGMGTVFEAVRDDAQYTQKAAIKLVKREMDSDLARRRFLQERQILAALDHPAIARLLDGGSTEDGLPYLVMEHIEGRDILAYASERKLSIDDRLRLFREVLGGVAFAHQKLVVHRDLKPSNILITAQGAPKLLDFGIARLVDPDLLDTQPLETATSAGMMTPDYASPEQARGEPVAPASDIYSLGAVLYELLTGARAHRLTTYSAAEIVQSICQTEPCRPSQAAPDRWRRKLAGDLDVIVLAALHKDAARRYPSAEALSEDLRRYLEGRPIRARQDTFVYRARKFVRRNVAAVAAGVAAAAALSAGIVMSTVQARRAEHRFQQVRQLANTLLFDIHSQIASVPGTTAARETIVKTSLQYLNSLAPDAPRDLALEWELASAYLQVGNIQGSVESANLGKGREAIESWTVAAELAGDVARRKREPRAFLLVSRARFGMSASYRGQLDVARAEEMARLDPGTNQGCASLYSGHNLRGDIRMISGAPDLALVDFDLALARVRECPETKWRPVSGLLRRGDALHALGRMQEAAETYREAANAAQLDSSRRQSMIWTHTQLANVLGAYVPANLGQRAEAEERLRAALTLVEAEIREDPKNLHMLQDLALVSARLAELVAPREPAEAERLASRALERVQGPAAENRGDTDWEEKPVLARAALARVRGRMRRPEAENLLRQAIVEWQGLAARNPRDMLWQVELGRARIDLGDLVAKTDRARAAVVWREALADLDRAAAAVPKHFPVEKTRQMAVARVESGKF